MRVSDEILQRMTDAYRRIRNTAKYLLSNINDFDPAQHLVPAEKMLPLDRWAVASAYRLQLELLQAYDEYQFHHIYHKLHSYCSAEMGGFYLDIVKDRQYTMQTDSLARRSTQTAMYHIVSAMARWLAPILSFTADEIWQHIPGEKSEIVFLGEWYDGLFDLSAEEKMNHQFWRNVIEVRDAFKKEMERMRVATGVGSSLDVEVDLYCGAEIYQQLNQLNDELRFILITSYARIYRDTEKKDSAIHYTLSSNDEIWVDVSATDHEKCVRCWHHREDVGENKEHPEICGRCVANVSGSGEERQFA
jgi:isoleucyl-tRNA synthetase